MTVREFPPSVVATMAALLLVDEALAPIDVLLSLLLLPLALLLHLDAARYVGQEEILAVL